jgi:hypothetical protein
MDGSFNKKFKQLQCQMNLLSLFHTKSFLVFPFLLLISCTSKWDPDLQFSQQNEKIRAKQKNYQFQLQQNAINNLRDLESEILLKVRIGTSNEQLNELVGFKYTILAQFLDVGMLWERRIYKWQDIVESKWDTYSLEYKLCKKNRDFIIVTTNEECVISVEYM